MAMPRKKSSSAFPFGLLIMLFVSARVMLLMNWPAENLALYGDYRYYFDLGALSDAGFFPFFHYWSEYPPLFPFLNLAFYQLSGGVFKNYVLVTSLALLLFEVGSLIFLFRLATDMHGETQATYISWVYVVLHVPVFIWLSTFEAMTLFFLLWALFALSRGRLWLSGLAIGLGAMTKLLPIVLLATVWRVRGWRVALLTTLVTLLVVGVILGPLLALSPSYTLASLRAQPAKSSWQTVWALIDGNVDNTGNFGPIADHFDPAKATARLFNPPRLPGWLTLIPFALVGLFVFTRPRLRDRDDGVIFTALAFVIFFLWARGWSPQWQIFLVVLLMLALPLRRAVLFILVLGFVNLLEWPLILSRGLFLFLPITVLARTFVLGLLAIELYRRLRQTDPGMPSSPGTG